MPELALATVSLILRYNEMINELNEKKVKANAKLEQLESASAEAWEEAADLF